MEGGTFSDEDSGMFLMKSRGFLTRWRGGSCHDLRCAEEIVSCGERDSSGDGHESIGVSKSQCNSLRTRIRASRQKERAKTEQMARSSIS